MMDFHKAKPGEADAESIGQVLLQRRGLLVMRGSAYKDLLHGIPSQGCDLVSDSCCNLHLTSGVSKGQRLPRAPVRKSMVFVHKMQH
mmetsp:Transcript_11002/g.26103  ORF Transcript_11002/g.26103 Transcript_11002/m.26103 type:complete len:87 (-) Transcript_11002:1834-2094(-)